MDTGNNSNFKELKEILNNKKKSFNKSELVNQLLSNIPKKNSGIHAGDGGIQKNHSQKKLSYEELEKENKRLRDYIETNGMNPYNEPDSAKNIITELKNENARLTMQLSHNISDSTNANTTVNHINVDIHSQEDLHKFMKFYKEISQGTLPAPSYNYKPENSLTM